MDDCQRTDPPVAGSDHEMLDAFLDWQRATLLCKLDGLSDEDLRRAPIASTSLTLLGIVKHLADVERGWLRETFAGEMLDDTWSADDPDRFFRIEPGETTDDILTFYREETERSRAISRAASLDDVAKESTVGRSLRWILLHMIEETARHIGHADLLREAIDGQTGE